MAWEKYLKIIIDHTKIDADMTDFPLAIVLSASAGIGDADVTAIFDELGANKYKIKIEDTSDNQRYVEIETWDQTAEKAVLHAKVDLSSSADTVFRLYYDATQADNTTYVAVSGETAAQNVWDSNFVAVYHMAQDPSVESVKDSTSNGNHGTCVNASTRPALVDSDFGKALDFDGTDDYINCSSGATLDDISSKTVEIKFNADGWGESGFGRLIKKAGLANFDGWQIFIDDSNGEKLAYIQRFDNNYGQWVSPNGSIDLNTNHCVTLVYDRSSVTNDAEITIDAVAQTVLETLTPTGSAITDATQDLWIGARQSDEASDREFDGKIAEVRLSNILRSSAWIKATHYSLHDSLLSFRAFKVSGTVKEGAANVARTIRAYSRETGELLGADTSSVADGSFEISGLSSNNEVNVVALDDASGTVYNDLIFSVIPVEG